MDQENSMDFKALRAKFQEEELLLRQPKIKPALPEKPKVVPPPTSPTHYLPAGARPSLLTSISQTLEGKSQVAPRVVFKDDKKESKKPLIQNHSKEGKLKKSKDKSSKGNREKLDEDTSDQKPKKESKEKKTSSLFTAKDNAAELVPASPPPRNTTPKKKGFLGFKKSTKKDSVEVISDPILDSPSPDVAGQVPLSPVPLIPVPSDFGDVPEPELSPPKALLPNIPPLPESCAAVEVTPPPISPETTDFTQPPLSSCAALQIETCLQGETPSPNVSRPASQNDFRPPSAVPTPPPSQADPPAAPTPSPAPPELAAAEPDIEAMIRAAVEKPPDPVKEPQSKTPSPKVEHPISALSALERAEELSPPGKRTPPCDQRIFNALEKARRKTSSSLSNLTPSTSVTPPPEELPPPQSPTHSFPELPPIDYEAGRPALLNGLDHGAASALLDGITEEGSDPIPELLVVPPPPPKKILPDPESLGVAPEKPDRPPSVDLGGFIPSPPVEDIPAPVDFSETDTTDVPEFDDVTSEAHSPELQVSEWGNGDHTGPDSPDGQNPPEFYCNRIPSPEGGAEVHAAPTYGDDPLLITSISIPKESPPPAGVPLAFGNGIYESTDNVYEDIGTSATKKKGKTDGKKRKGPPKNPYAEAAQDGSEEKSKTGKFSKNDKKVPAEGPDEKELKKREKQRQEKERKEQKEKQEREKKEQKEKEKKENEIKKKFKITGQEDAMYEATVIVTTKGRKNDLPVNDGDVISIIRTTNCPKGKWLAKDSSNNYGYIAVDHVRLDIQEMLNMGKKAAVSRKTNNNNNEVETEVTRTSSRSSNHYPLSAESYDSEEWTGDDDEPLTPPLDATDPQASLGHTRTLSMPDMGNKELNVNHQHSHSDINPDGTHVQARHEALQKLATFFHTPKPVEPAASSAEAETGPAPLREEAAALPEADVKQELDFDQSDLFILPPPDLYADLTVE